MNQPTTPTSLELNNSSNKPQASPNIFNSSSSSSLSKINVKNNNDDQNRNTIIAYNENKSDHKHETLLLSQRSHTNYLDSPESNKMDEINAKIHPIIHLKCDVDSVPTPTKAAITMYPTMRMINSLAIAKCGEDIQRTSSSLSSSFNSSSSSLTLLSSATKTMTKNIYTRQPNNYLIRKKFNINRKIKTSATNVRTNKSLYNKNNDYGKRSTIRCNEFPTKLNHLKEINCDHYVLK